MAYLHCGKFELSLARPLLMGIVNLTPDSFSGDGLSGSADLAIAHARKQFAAGADLLDLGAESSRPGAIATPEGEELQRLMPVLEEVSTWGLPISVDTYKPVVMRAAIAAGASMINDITGLQNPEALSVVSASQCAVCIMHMQGEPRTMQLAPEYRDVLAEVRQFLLLAVNRCKEAKIERNRVVLDPGFGFGKSLQHNLAMLRSLREFAIDELPVLVGLSRKSMLGAITGRPVTERLAASVAAALLAAQAGAKLIRVHDVAETRDALAVWSAIQGV